MIRITVRRSGSPFRSRRWYWVARADNGRKIATSGEGYANRAHAFDMARKVVIAANPDALIEP